MDISTKREFRASELNTIKSIVITGITDGIMYFEYMDKIGHIYNGYCDTKKAV